MPRKLECLIVKDAPHLKDRGYQGHEKNRVPLTKTNGDQDRRLISDNGCNSSIGKKRMKITYTIRRMAIFGPLLEHQKRRGEEGNGCCENDSYLILAPRKVGAEGSGEDWSYWDKRLVSTGSWNS